jgi:hypothetical protein
LSKFHAPCIKLLLELFGLNVTTYRSNTPTFTNPPLHVSRLLFDLFTGQMAQNSTPYKFDIIG